LPRPPSPPRRPPGKKPRTSDSTRKKRVDAAERDATERIRTALDEQARTLAEERQRAEEQAEHLRRETADTVAAAHGEAAAARTAQTRAEAGQQAAEQASVKAQATVEQLRTELAELRQQHRTELDTLRAESRAEHDQLRTEHRDQLADVRAVARTAEQRADEHRDRADRAEAIIAGATLPRSAAATSPRRTWRSPAHATRGLLPACSASDARPGRRRRHQRPQPGRHRARRCGRSPVPPSSRRRAAQTIGDHPTRQTRGDSTRDLLTLPGSEMTGPTPLGHRANTTRLTQEPLDPRHRHTQRPLHPADRLSAPPQRPQLVLLLRAQPHRTDTHPNLHQHIFVDLH